MARSAKKGPFVDESLLKKVQRAKESGKRDPETCCNNSCQRSYYNKISINSYYFFDRYDPFSDPGGYVITKADRTYHFKYTGNDDNLFYR